MNKRTVTIEVDVDLSTINTDDLVEELKHRNMPNWQLENIWHLRRQGKSYEAELDAYISEILGVVV